MYRISQFRFGPSYAISEDGINFVPAQSGKKPVAYIDIDLVRSVIDPLSYIVYAMIQPSHILSRLHQLGKW